MTAKPLGVAVVGLGVGEEHARAFARAGCELRWLADLDLDKANAVAHDLGALKVTNDVEAILEDPEVDIVSIASYDDAHFAQVVAALKAEKHVFVEKPLCRTIDELRAVKAAWAAHGGRIKLASNLVLRSAPLYVWLKAAIDSGLFGTVYSFDGDYLYGRIHKITEGWRSRIPEYSVMLGGAIHLIDLLLWLTCERPTSVTAAGNALCTEGTAFRCRDFVASTLRLPSGAIGRITANFGCVHGHQHAVRVFGSRATFVCDDMGPRLHRHYDPSSGAETVEQDALPPSKGELIAPFVSAVRLDYDVATETQQAFDAISVCVACDEAERSGSAAEVVYV